MYNILQMNDWNIEKYLKVVILIHLILWGTIGLDAIGFGIPAMRQLIGFIYLLFIPGITILRTLELHKLGNIETLLYTVGLSIATLMFAGPFMSIVYPLFGISGPITIMPLVTTISAIILILCVICYARDKKFSNPEFINASEIFTPQILFLCLIPFLSVLGIRVMDFYNDNTLLQVLIIVIALIALFIGFDKFIHNRLYPLAIFVIALSLLFYNSLIGNYVYGSDIMVEYYFANLVKLNSIWDPSIGSNLNSMLSLVSMAPICSIVCNMDIEWVFKIIYPLLFSLAPLGLYQALQKFIDSKAAFFSCFFFMSESTFFGVLPELARQEIAELFVVLLIMLMIENDIDGMKKAFLSIVFGISLAVSHYATVYIFLFNFIMALLLLILSKNNYTHKLDNCLHARYNSFKNSQSHKKMPFLDISSSKKSDKSFGYIFALFLLVFTLTWFMHVSSGAPINTIAQIGDQILSSIFTDFLNPEKAEGLNIMMGTKNKVHLSLMILLLSNIYVAILFLNQFLIIIGSLVLLLEYSKVKIIRIYIAIIVPNLLMLFAGVSVPFLAKSINMNRLYHITLIFLAPTCIIGAITLLKGINHAFKISWTDENMRHSLRILSVYFVIFLLYQTSFVLSVAQGHFGSRALNETAEWRYYTDQEVAGAIWLKNIVDTNSIRIYSDENGYQLLSSRIDMKKIKTFLADKIPEKSSYIYFNTQAVLKKRFFTIDRSEIRDALFSINAESIVIGRSKIFANGGSDVYI